MFSVTFWYKYSALKLHYRKRTGRSDMRQLITYFSLNRQITWTIQVEIQMRKKGKTASNLKWESTLEGIYKSHQSHVYKVLVFIKLKGWSKHLENKRKRRKPYPQPKKKTLEVLVSRLLIGSSAPTNNQSKYALKIQNVAWILTHSTLGGGGGVTGREFNKVSCSWIEPLCHLLTLHAVHSTNITVLSASLKIKIQMQK